MSHLHESEELSHNLKEATEALIQATTVLKNERTTRRVQFGFMAVAYVILAWVLFVTVTNQDAIERNAIIADLADCADRNDSREAIRGVLLVLIADDVDRTAYEQGKIEQFLVSLEDGVLAPIDCKARAKK